MLEKSLDYWYELEIFQPRWPIRESIDIRLSEQNLPWPLKNPDPGIREYFDIYLGQAIAYNLIKWTLDTLGLTEEESPIERDQSKLCLCTLKVDQKGMYVGESFALSSFAWALGRMVQGCDFGIKLDLTEMQKFEREIDAAFMDNQVFSFGGAAKNL